MSLRPRILFLQKCYLLPDQDERLNDLGEIIQISIKKTDEELLFTECQKAKVIVSKKQIFEYSRVYDLKEKMIVVPFGKRDFWSDIDIERFNSNRVTIIHIPRRYKEAVGEWVVYMMLSLSRGIHKRIRTDDDMAVNLSCGKSLFGKSVLILGKGVIGTHIGGVLKAFGMFVKYGQRGDNFTEMVSDADFIINAISSKPFSKPIIPRSFFISAKPGSYFISVASPSTYVLEDLQYAIRINVISGAADDVADSHIGDSKDPLYREYLKDQNILVTPHIAWRTDVEARYSFDQMISAITEYIKKRDV